MPTIAVIFRVRLIDYLMCAVFAIFRVVHRYMRVGLGNYIRRYMSTLQSLAMYKIYESNER